MRQLLIALFLFTAAAPSAAVELFGVPLVSADKARLGLAARAAGATLSTTAKPEVFEVFDSREILAESRTLYLGFDAQDASFAFAEYHINPLAHRRMLEKLRQKYGEPRIESGKFISDQLHSWTVDGIEITYQRQWGCRCSTLLYSSPQKLTTLQTQHRAIQQQRQDEGTRAQINNY